MLGTTGRKHLDPAGLVERIYVCVHDTHLDMHSEAIIAIEVPQLSISYSGKNICLK